VIDPVTYQYRMLRSVNMLAQRSDYWVASAFPVAFPVIAAFRSFLLVSGRSGHWKQNKFKREKRTEQSTRLAILNTERKRKY
jgi:hypothetical protein